MRLGERRHRGGGDVGSGGQGIERRPEVTSQNDDQPGEAGDLDDGRYEDDDDAHDGHVESIGLQVAGVSGTEPVRARTIVDDKRHPYDRRHQPDGDDSTSGARHGHRAAMTQRVRQRKVAGDGDVTEREDLRRAAEHVDEGPDVAGDDPDGPAPV